MSSKNESEEKKDDLRKFLEVFYSKHNPEKLNTLDIILQKFNGKEEQLIIQLREKYGSEMDCYLPDSLAVFVKTVDGDDNKGDDNKPAIFTTTPSSSAQGNSLSTISAGMQDISANLAASFFTGVGWSKNSSQTPSNFSSSRKEKEGDNVIGSISVSAPSSLPGANIGISNNDEAMLLSRVNVLQAEVHAKDEEVSKLQNSIKRMQSQISSLVKEKTKIQTDFTDVSFRLESSQRNVVTITEREQASNNEIIRLNELIKVAEIAKAELNEKLNTAVTQRDNKDTQLKELVEVNHRLSAQLRFLASRLLENDPVVSMPAPVTAAVPSSSATLVSPVPASSPLTPSGKNSEDPVVAPTTPTRKHLPNDHSTTENTTIPITNTITEIPHTISSDNLECISDNSSNNNSSSSSGNNNSNSIAINKTIGFNLPDQPNDDNLLRLEISENSLYATRAELRLAMKERQLAESALEEQSVTLEALQQRLDKILRELQMASGSADTMQRQIASLASDLTATKSQLTDTNIKLNEKGKQLAESQREAEDWRVRCLASEILKKDLSVLCTTHARNAESHAMQLVTELADKVLMEREEHLSRLAMVAHYHEQASAAQAEAVQVELVRLRDDIFKSRRAEAQKDRELVFMQRQLCEAAGRIAVLMDGGAAKPYE